MFDKRRTKYLKENFLNKDVAILVAAGGVRIVLPGKVKEVTNDFIKIYSEQEVPKPQVDHVSKKAKKDIDKKEKAEVEMVTLSQFHYVPINGIISITKQNNGEV